MVANYTSHFARPQPLRFLLLGFGKKMEEEAADAIGMSDA